MKTILILILMAASALAATHPATSASRTDVLAAIALCSPGDTVTVPAGTVSWSGGISITGITLQGAGKTTSGTVITAGAITITKHASQNSKFIGFRFTGGDFHFQINGSLTAKPFVVGDCYFFAGADFGDVTTNGGLFYNCEFFASSPTGADWFTLNLGGTGTAGQTSWEAAPSMGTLDTTGETNTYFEDCTWTNLLEAAFDADNGARAVVRHSTLIDSSFGLHGGGSGSSLNDTSSYGNKHVEVYDSTFDRVSNSAALNKWIWWRGATGVFANNAVENADSPDGSSFPNKPEIRLSVGCQGGAYPRTYQVGQAEVPADSTPNFPLLIFGNTGTGAAGGTGTLEIVENPNNPCSNPTSFIQAGRDYQTSNTWGWVAYPYPHPLRSGAAPAATYYVNQNTGSDSNAGTQSLPWKNCPGMSGTSNYTGSGSLSPGDTVYLDRADTWNVSSASTGGFYLVGGVTYIGNSYGTGSTKAKIRANGACAAGVVRFRDHATVETEFEGFEVDGNSQVANGIDINGAFAQLLTGATKRVQDCEVHHTFSRQSLGQYTYGIIISNHGGSSTYCDNVEIINTVVHDTSRDSIVLYPGDENANCRIQNILVRGCTAYNTGQDPDYTAGSGIVIKGYVVNAIIENNTVFNTQASNYFFNSNETNHFGVGIENAVVRNNIAYGTGQGGILIYHGSGADPMDIEFYGNIIYGTYSTAGFWIDSNVGNTVSFLIYNNTFLAPVVISNPTATGTINFRNNIVSVGNEVPFTDTGTDIDTHSNNTFRRSTGTTLVTAGGSSYTSANLTTYEATGLASDPSFLNAAAPPTGFSGTYPALVPNTTGLSIPIGSTSANSGADLGTSFNSSINGITRTGSWDRGAYELTSDTTAPTPNPMTFASAPNAVDAASITMTATTASDASAVEYWFDETTGTTGGTDSGWQSSPVYVDSGLSASTQYTYRVKARDTSLNETSYSSTASATTTTATGGTVNIETLNVTNLRVGP